jgi:hypothetical protein
MTFYICSLVQAECNEWVGLMNDLITDIQMEQSSNAMERGIVTEGKFWKDKAQLENLRLHKHRQRQFNNVYDISKINVGRQVSKRDFYALQVVGQQAETEYGSIFTVQDRRRKNSLNVMHVVKKGHPDLQVYDTNFRDMSTLEHPYLLKQLYFGDCDDVIWSVYSPAASEESSLLT